MSLDFPTDTPYYELTGSSCCSKHLPTCVRASCSDTVIEELTFASCPGIETGVFDEVIDASVISAIIQAYCILIPTILSIGRQELSLFDANYALKVTSSPFMIHVVFSSIRDILGFETGLFKRIESRRRIIHFSVVLFLALWFGLRLTLRLSNKAFRDSELCSNPTFKGSLSDFLLLFVSPTGPAGGFWFALFVPLTIFLFSIILGWRWVWVVVNSLLCVSITMQYLINQT